MIAVYAISAPKPNPLPHNRQSVNLDVFERLAGQMTMRRVEHGVCFAALAQEMLRCALAADALVLRRDDREIDGIGNQSVRFGMVRHPVE